MNNSIYIHIPFCCNLCSYCDFAKVFYDEDLASKYLDSLELEFKEKYRGELIKTLYIGGGSPSSLSNKNLKKLLKIIKIFNVDKNVEFTIELNPDDIKKEKLILLKKAGVNRISIGVESTNDKFLKYLKRTHKFDNVKDKINLIKEVGFNNISVDLIYGMKNETIEDLKNDLDNILMLDINHISTYSLEIKDHTIFGIRKEKRLSDDKDAKLYEFIVTYLEKNHFKHYEISNFAKNGKLSQHNMVYWNNNNYYGFGVGAAGYINNIRYQNTKSIRNYLSGKRDVYNEILKDNDIISYALILGFRLVDGINKEEFKQKYHVNILSLYNISSLIKEGFLIDDGLFLKINPQYLYVENSILSNFI